MGTCERFSIGNLRESLREGAGKALGVMAAAAWVVSGCAAPTSETKPADTGQGQENTQTDSEGNPDLDWKLVDAGCGRDCEEGELLGTVPLYYTHTASTTSKAVSPPSPTALNAATFRQQLKAAPRQPLKQHPLQPTAIKLDTIAHPRQIAAPLL